MAKRLPAMSQSQALTLMLAGLVAAGLLWWLFIAMGWNVIALMPIPTAVVGGCIAWAGSAPKKPSSPH